MHVFLTRLRKFGFIEDVEGLTIRSSLLSAVLHDQRSRSINSKAVNAFGLDS